MAILNQTLSPNAIFWTGDNPSHDMMRLTENDVFYSTRNLSKIIAESFPGVPVYPVLANHDYWPANFQAFNETEGTMLTNIVPEWLSYFPDTMTE